MGSPPELRQRMSCSQLARAQRSFQTIPSYSLRARLVGTLTLTKETDHGACQPSGELHTAFRINPDGGLGHIPEIGCQGPEWPWHRCDRRQLRRPNASQHRDPSHPSLVRHQFAFREIHADVGRRPGCEKFSNACCYEHILTSTFRRDMAVAV